MQRERLPPEREPRFPGAVFGRGAGTLALLLLAVLSLSALAHAGDVAWAEAEGELGVRTGGEARPTGSSTDPAAGADEPTTLVGDLALLIAAAVVLGTILLEVRARAPREPGEDSDPED